MNQRTGEVAWVVDGFQEPHFRLALGQRTSQKAQLIKELSRLPVAHRDRIDVTEGREYAPRREHIAQTLLRAVDATQQAASVEAKDRSQPPITSRRSSESLLHHLEAGCVVATVGAGEREPVEHTGRQLWVLA